MKLIDRYLLREYLFPVGYCLAGFAVVFAIKDLFDHLDNFVKASTPLHEVLRYYGNVFVPALEYLAPASLLLATLYTLWQLGRNNELLAMRASGIGLHRIMVPFLGVGLAFALGTLAVKELLAPAAMYEAVSFARNGYRERRTDVYLNHAYYNKAARRLWLVDEFDARHPRRLFGVTVTQETPDGRRALEVRAPRAEYLDDEWWFFGARVQRFTGRDRPDGPPRPAEPDPGQPRVFGFDAEAPADFANSTREWEFLSSREMMRHLRAHPNLSAHTLSERRFDLHSRLAMPWACLVVTLFGIPAGAGTARRGALTGVLMAVAFFVAFHGLNQVGLLVGRRGLVWPWLGAWLSNIVFFVAGSAMAWRLR